MKNLLDELRDSGLTHDQATRSIEVIYHWVEERYPVLAAISKPVINNEIRSAAPDRDAGSRGKVVEEDC